MADSDIKLRPRNFNEDDPDQLQRSPSLFARIFDAKGSAAILSVPEGHQTRAVTY